MNLRVRSLRSERLKLSESSTATAGQPLTVHQLKPAWSRVMMARYILRLRARIRELEKRLATYE